MPATPATAFNDVATCSNALAMFPELACPIAAKSQDLVRVAGKGQGKG